MHGGLTKNDEVSSNLIVTCSKKYCSSSQGVGSVQEDALQTVGALIEVVGNDFARYMQTFNPFLCQALENYAESSVSETL